jgi:hypothetical protein
MAPGSEGVLRERGHGVEEVGDEVLIEHRAGVGWDAAAPDTARMEQGEKSAAVEVQDAVEVVERRLSRLAVCDLEGPEPDLNVGDVAAELTRELPHR